MVVPWVLQLATPYTALCVFLQLKQQALVSWECQNEVFRQEVEGADDIRLNAPLVSKCMGDKKMFCKDVAPGTKLHP